MFWQWNKWMEILCMRINGQGSKNLLIWYSKVPSILTMKSSGKDQLSSFQVLLFKVIQQLLSNIEDRYGLCDVLHHWFIIITNFIQKIRRLWYCWDFHNSMVFNPAVTLDFCWFPKSRLAPAVIMRWWWIHMPIYFIWQLAKYLQCQTRMCAQFLWFKVLIACIMVLFVAQQ